MPLAKIHVHEGRYDQNRMAKVSAAIQAALMNTLRVPPEGFYQLIFQLPRSRFLHTPSFVGMHYTDDLIVLDLTFIQGRPKETRLALLKDVNTRVAAAAAVSPDDIMITLYEVPGENISFGQGEAQRAKAVAGVSHDQGHLSPTSDRCSALPPRADIRTCPALVQQLRQLGDIGRDPPRLIPPQQQCPLYPQKRTLVNAIAMSALCPKADIQPDRASRDEVTTAEQKPRQHRLQSLR